MIEVISKFHINKDDALFFFFFFSKVKSVLALFIEEIVVPRRNR